MASKERVRCALSRNIPDRVPIDYSANSGIDARLIKHFGLNAGDHEGLRKALGVDFRGIGAPYRGPRLHAEVAERGVDPEWGIRTRRVDHGSGEYWDFCDFPLKDASAEVIAPWPMPSPDDYDYTSVAADCRANAAYGLYVGGAGLGDIMNSTGMLCGVEQMLMGLAMQDAALLTLIDRRLEIQLEVTRRVLDAANGAIDLLWMGEDLGTQAAAMISLDMYRSILRPRHQKFVDLGTSYGVPAMIHCCGSSSWAFDDFIDMGIAAVDTLQPEARDMAPAYLKSRFGKRLAFHGCISTAGVVAFGSVEDVVANVKETLRVMMPGGGYCLSPTHALQDNSPVENVVAMYETAREFGEYRGKQ
jgi:uroporphyrinogen decarboxylase